MFKATKMWVVLFYAEFSQTHQNKNNTFKKNDAVIMLSNHNIFVFDYHTIGIPYCHHD